ncbi:fimbrillin family protein [Bacteroides sp.]|uniref:fimbrillin family protein n=1 Tax=Bacteroides sp. TaxID=29523 RepID=UPI00262B8700|nr:fimbrillin family protein [Bacteroides sp.]MDD3036572.1 fimbrillin family protein [Bacteroides sp.]
MKKILLAVATVMAITGCSQNEEFDAQGTNNEINVGTIVKKSPRATVTDNASFKAFTLSSFIVDENQNYGTNGLGSAYMDGISYSGIKGNWTTDGGKYYWPTAKNVQFFGYSGGTNFAAPATGYPTLSFTIENTSNEQKDLVVAAVNTGKPADDAKVQLDFKHILTKINFSYKPENGYTYAITKLEIKGIKGGTATYTFAADPVDGNWGEGSSSVTYEYPVTIGNTATDGYYTLDSTNGSLMLLPQTIATDVATVSIAYTATKAGGYTYTAENKVIKIPASTWTVGQSIRYKLALPAGDGEIGVDTDVVNNWDTETPSEIQ